MLTILLELGSWGRKYKGDFIAGTIAFFVPFLITWAINGFYDIVTLTSLFGSVFLIIVLVLGHPKIFSITLNRWRKDKFDKPIRIGILNGFLYKTPNNLPNRPYTEYEPVDWYNAFSSQKNFVADWVSASEISGRFDIIVNPFGEEYPEVDKPNRATLRRIVHFVKQGGIFVNVAGLAFYYLWDGETEDLSGPLYETYQLRNIPGLLERVVLLRASHLLDCSLYNCFGVRTTMFSATVIPVRAVADEFFKGLDTIGGVGDVKEFRSAYRSEKEEAILKPLLKAEYTLNDPSQDSKPITFACYPIAAVKLGRGYLLLNGIKLEKSRPTDFKKEIEAIRRVCQKLGSKGFL